MKRMRHEEDRQIMLALYEPDAPDEPDEPPPIEPGDFDMVDLRGWKVPPEWTLAPGEEPESAIREYLNHWYGRRIR